MTGGGREERAWVRAAQAGSAPELEALFHRYWPAVYRAAYLIVHDRLSAEEIAQEAFLAAVRTLDRFGRDRPFGPWLYRSVVSRSIDGARGRVARRGPAREALLEVDDPLGWGQPVVDPLADEADAAFAAGLGLLSPEQRAGIVLRYLLGVPPGQVADILDLRRSTANARLRGAREYLEARLGAATTARAEDLRAYLLSFPVPDEERAEEHAWEVVRAAYATREPAERGFELPVVPIAFLVLVAACVAVAVSPAGGEIWSWVQDRVGRDEPVEAAPSERSLPALPAPGRLLVTAGATVLVVEADGSQRELGAYEGAVWSPTGALVAAWSGRELAALDPDGAGIQWSIEQDGLSGVRWGAGGFRVAYLRGGTLRVVEGNGTDDRELAEQAGQAAPAWRPTDEDVLAFADATGRVVAVNAETGRTIWRTARGPAVSALAWTADGELLVTLDERRIRAMLGPRRVFRTVRLPEGAAPGELAPRPGAREVAYTLAAESGETAVYLFDVRRGTSRLLFAGAGSLAGLAWSPDGGTLLAGWPAARQWVFIPVGQRGQASVVADVPDLVAGDGFPRVEGWCCAGQDA